MKSRFVLFTLSVIVGTLMLAACGGAAATEAPAVSLEGPVAPEQSAQKVGDGVALPQSADVAALPAPTLGPAFEISNQAGENIVVQNIEAHSLPFRGVQADPGLALFAPVDSVPTN